MPEEAICSRAIFQKKRAPLPSKKLRKCPELPCLEGRSVKRSKREEAGGKAAGSSGSSRSGAWVPRSLKSAKTMPIVYALISRGKTVLAEYTSTSGNFPTVTRVLLSKIPTENSKMSYVYDKWVARTADCPLC